jgi:hypothetical protein
MLRRQEARPEQESHDTLWSNQGINLYTREQYNQANTHMDVKNKQHPVGQ